MNDPTTTETRPEVADFVDRVRDRLADLSDEERDELLGGLEADLSERVADGDLSGLGDPAAYADEMRAAAGLERGRGRARGRPWQHRPHRPRRPLHESVTGWLEAAREQWERAVAARPWTAATWEVLQVLRPAWWVLRAWVAVELLDLYTGPYEHATLVPRFGDDIGGTVLLVAAVAGSVLLGLRRAWPASHSPGSTFARVTLLGLNVFALLMIAPVVDAFPSAGMFVSYGHPVRTYDHGGLRNDGHLVRNVFAYDADGQPLEGVQLYDQDGMPLAVEPGRVLRVRYQGERPMLYSWANGQKGVWNVFPLPVRTDDGGWSRKDGAWSSANPPFLPQPPLAVVPPVTLPLPEADAPPDRS